MEKLREPKLVLDFAPEISVQIDGFFDLQ